VNCIHRREKRERGEKERDINPPLTPPPPPPPLGLGCG